MTDSTPPTAAPPLKKPPKGWFARSWWWFLPLVIGGPILCCCGGGGGMFYFMATSISGIVEDSQAYKEGVKILEDNPEVQQELGTPIDVATGFDVIWGGGSANISQSGSTHTLDARLPVSGPNGSGYLVIEAEGGGSGGVTFKTLRLDADSGNSIDLMPGLPGGAGMQGLLPGGMIPPPGPDGIGLVGHPGVYVGQSARLPRSINPNAATGIEPNQDDEPWTAFRGTQTNILRSTAGGRRSQMREVYVPSGFELIRVDILNSADNTLLGEARRASRQIYIRCGDGSEYEAIGYALLHGDESITLSLRDNDYQANDLPLTTNGEALYVYFQLPVGVSVVELVLGGPDSEGVKLVAPIQVRDH